MIAAVFHWPPSAMDRMGLAELMDWEGRAEQVLTARRGG
ncbi:MAG TPA: GpE family phage tail protein [Lamprocystis sp. (in: g-proteobacteria)]|nr:GpE family phage tail protein [Lamprocystis sp. (in: g-proteobacteria)]